MKMFSKTHLLVLLLIFLVAVNIIKCHEEDTILIEELEEQVKDIKIGNENINGMIEALHNAVFNKLKETEDDINSAKHIKDEARKREERMSKVMKFINRIEKLEANIKLIENYMSGEKETDSVLRDLEGGLGEKFKKDKSKANAMASEMKQSMENVFDGLKKELQDVENFANSRNVIIGGVMYYAGIGSACGSSYDVCRIDNSVCRDGKCQCRTGLSYDHLQQTCVETCEAGYGDTYQTVNNYIIRGYNNVAANKTSLEECKQLCEQEETFLCRSFDYFPRWEACYLSENVKYEASEGWEYNSAGIHFQRDCKIEKE